MQDRSNTPPESLELLEAAPARTSQIILATPQARAGRRPLWRSQHLTNALFKAFRRTAKPHEVREPSPKDP